MRVPFTHTLLRVRKEFRKSQKGLRNILTAASIAVLCLFLWWTQVGAYSDTLLLTVLYWLRGARPAPADVVIVGIDDESYKALGLSPRQPFPRGVFADALKKIHDYTPKLVVMDLYAPKETQDPVANEKLVAALKSGPTAILRVELESIPGRESEGPSGTTLSYQSDEMFRQAASIEVPFRALFVGDSVYKINVKEKADANELERIPLLNALRRFIRPDIRAPGYRDLTNFYGPAGTLNRVSLHEVLSSEQPVPEGFFRDKVVFIGFQSHLRERGQRDNEVFNVPASWLGMYGVEIYATVGANLLDGSWLRRLPFETENDMILILSFILFLGMASLGPLKAGVWLLAFVAGWFGASYFSFVKLGCFVPGVGLLVFVGPLFFALGFLVVAITALRERAAVERSFGVKPRR